MAIYLPHKEDSNSTDYIPPRGEFHKFLDPSHYAEKVREWGLSGTKEVKKEFWYKDKTHQRLVTIVGFESYGITAGHDTLIIEFKDGNLSCIHPAYLKEMQASSFGKELILQNDGDGAEMNEMPSSLKVATPIPSPAPKQDQKESKPVKANKEKPAKLILPGEKVHFTGNVKQFALSWNHFNEENDEVVVLENVIINQEEPIEVGIAWCSHSKTLKKFELTIGDALEFDGKIVKKSLPKGKDVEDPAFMLDTSVSYKINNPSKIKKG
jgi:hypothetical protein